MGAGSVDDVFDTMLNRIKDLIRTGNYDGCANRISDLFAIATCFENKTGLFVSTVLGDAIERVEYTIQTRMIDADRQSEIGNQLLDSMDAVLKSYKKDDKGELFNALSEISSAAAKFSFYSFELPKRQENEDHIDR